MKKIVQLSLVVLAFATSGVTVGQAPLFDTPSVQAQEVEKSIHGFGIQFLGKESDGSTVALQPISEAEVTSASPYTVHAPAFSGWQLSRIILSFGDETQKILSNGSVITVNDFVGKPVSVYSGSLTYEYVRVADPILTTTPVHRLYNPDLQVHLYTTDQNEVNILSTRGWRYEGISWITEKTAGDAVYRMYNEGLKVHLYTKDANEYKVLANRGWRQEGVAYRSKGTVPVYRLYNAGLRKHLYTIDKNEYNILAGRGWQQEGVAWYSLPFAGGKG